MVGKVTFNIRINQITPEITQGYHCIQNLLKALRHVVQQWLVTMRPVTLNSGTSSIEYFSAKRENSFPFFPSPMTFNLK